MILPKKIFGSSIGRKAAMAVTGAGLILFLVAHLAGNLLMFAGQDAMNSYAYALKSNPGLLWGVRSGLIVIFLLHLYLGITLKLENARARPTRYAYNNTIQASFASRTMIWTGLLILAFVLMHLGHFTMGYIYPDYFHMKDAQGRHDAYNMVVLGFQVVPLSITYIVAMVILAAHLSHGLPSMFQSVGWNSTRFDAMFKTIGRVVALLLLVGFTSIPISVLAGIIKLQ